MTPSEDRKERSSPMIRNYGAIALQMLLLPLSVALLQHIDLLSLSGTEVLIILLLLAIPIAFYQLEFPLFTHRLVLEETTTQDGTGRSMLWMATIKKMIIFCASVFGAWLILLLCHDLHPYYWYAFYIQAGVLLVIYLVLTRTMIAGEVRTKHHGLIGRRLNQYIIVALLAMSFVYLGYDKVGVPDLRGSRLEDIWAEAFRAKFDVATNRFMGVSLGIAHAASQSAWFFMQVIASVIPEDAHKPVIWLLFLLPAAVQAALIVQLQLGLLALVEWKEDNYFKLLGKSTSARLFFGVFFILVIGSAWLDYRVSEADLKAAGEKVGDVIIDADPCRSWGADDSAFSADEMADMEKIGEAVKPLVNELIGVKTNFVYKRMDRHIDNYLDWYYSQGTQFTLQVLALADTIGRTNPEKSRLKALINAQIKRYIMAPYTGGMSGSNGAFASLTNELLHKEFAAYAQQLQDKRQYLSSYQGDLCVAPALLDLETLIGAMQYPTGNPIGPAGTGAAFVTAAMAAKIASKKLVATVAGKTAAKAGLKLGASISAKAAAAGASTVSVASLGAVCGPAAPACAVLGGVTAAILFEIAFNKADEALTRPNAKSDLKIAMYHMTIKARDAYITTYDELIDDAIKRTFRPDYVPSEN